MQQEIIDISEQKVSDDTLREIEPNLNSGDPIQLYRINLEQSLRILELGKVLSLSAPATSDVMRQQITALFKKYESIPKGAYYSWLGPLPEMSDDFLRSTTIHFDEIQSHVPTDWISRKRYEGFVTRGLEFYFHSPDPPGQGGCMKTIDRCVEIHWGKYGKHIPLVLPIAQQKLFQKTAIVDEAELKQYLKDGFDLIDTGEVKVTLSRYQCAKCGVPLTSRLVSGRDLIGFVERFLGFTEAMIPYSEEAYSSHEIPNTRNRGECITTH